MIPLGMALDTAVAFLKRYKALIAIIPLCLALAWQTYQVSRWKGKEADARATIAQMQVASEQARAKQIAINNANQELSQRIATDATLRHAEIANAANRAVADYVSRNRVQNYCRGSGPGSTAVPGNPEASDRPYADEVLAVPRNDFEALAKDAVRGAEARAFLIDLINEGLAVQD